MKQLYCIIIILLFYFFKSNAYELIQNECTLLYEISEKTAECFMKWPQHEDKCKTGKSLLIDYFNLTKCDSLFKRIHKRETIISPDFILTLDFIYELGDTVHLNACDQLNNGKMKCFSTFGSIKCVQKSNKFNWQIENMCKSNEICLSKTKMNAKCLAKHPNLNHKCDWKNNGRQVCVNKYAFKTCANFAWTHPQSCSLGTKCATHPISTKHILCIHD